MSLSLSITHALIVRHKYHHVKTSRSVEWECTSERRKNRLFMCSKRCIREWYAFSWTRLYCFPWVVGRLRRGGGRVRSSTRVWRKWTTVQRSHTYLPTYLGMSDDDDAVNACNSMQLQQKTWEGIPLDRGTRLNNMFQRRLRFYLGLFFHLGYFFHYGHFFYLSYYFRLVTFSILAIFQFEILFPFGLLFPLKVILRLYN